MPYLHSFFYLFIFIAFLYSYLYSFYIHFLVIYSSPSALYILSRTSAAKPSRLVQFPTNFPLILSISHLYIFHSKSQTTMQHFIYLSIFITEIRVENLRPSVVGTFASLADTEENFCYSSQKLIVGFTQCECRGRGREEWEGEG